MSTRHILLVDDEKCVRDCVSTALSRAGYSVTVLANGTEALAMLEGELMESGRFDLLITDMNMPKLNGLALIDALRNKGTELPAVVMSGLGDEALFAETKSRRCVKLLSKPFSIATLITCVIQALEHVPANSRVSDHASNNSIKYK